MADVDLHGAAALLHRSYHSVQKTWRKLPGFPPPFIGGGKGERPWWVAEDIEAYKRGRRWPAAGEGQAAPAPDAAPIANDPTPRRVRTDPVNRLRAAAGGR